MQKKTKEVNRMPNQQLNFLMIYCLNENRYKIERINALMDAYKGILIKFEN